MAHFLATNWIWILLIGGTLSTNWRGINASNQLDLLVAGHRFVDGRLQLAQPSLEEAAA